MEKNEKKNQKYPSLDLNPHHCNVKLDNFRKIVHYPWSQSVPRQRYSKPKVGIASRLRDQYIIQRSRAFIQFLVYIGGPMVYCVCLAWIITQSSLVMPPQQTSISASSSRRSSKVTQLDINKTTTSICIVENIIMTAITTTTIEGNIPSLT